MFDEGIKKYGQVEYPASSLIQNHRPSVNQPNSSMLGAAGSWSMLSRLNALSLFCLLQLLGVAHAFADDLDVFNLEAGIQRTFDNNLFRLPDSVDPSTLGISGHSRSDTVNTLYVGFLVDKPLGQQKLHLEAVDAENRYQNYGKLNSSTRDYNANWQWTLTPRFTGKLSADRNQTIQSFANIQLYNALNIVTVNSHRVDADWSPLGNWHLIAAFSDRTSINSQAYYQDQSNESKLAEGGAKYVFSSGASLSVIHDRNIGTFLSQPLDATNQLDTGFHQNENKIILAWPITGKSLVNAEIGNLDRKYDHFSSRDYSGTTSNISCSNDLTNKINLTASVARTFNPWTDNTESYYVNNTGSLQASWQPVSKLALKLRFDTYKHDFRDPIPGITVPTPRIDNGNTQSMEADWGILRTVSIVGTVVRDKRGSTIAGWNYNDTSVTLSINAKF